MKGDFVRVLYDHGPKIFFDPTLVCNVVNAGSAKKRSITFQKGLVKSIPVCDVVGLKFGGGKTKPGPHIGLARIVGKHVVDFRIG